MKEYIDRTIWAEWIRGQRSEILMSIKIILTSFATSFTPFATAAQFNCDH